MPTYLTCLRAYVPTCLRALNYFVPTCLRALNYYVPTCPHLSRAYVPTCLQIYIYFSCLRALIFTCQRAIKLANVPKVCQFFNLACQRAKRRANFSTSPAQFLNFSIVLNICKLQEYLGNSRKFISRSKEFKV